MRYRYKATTAVKAASLQTDLLTGAVSYYGPGGVPHPETYVESESSMWDEVSSNKDIKPCTHCSFVVAPLGGTRSVYNDADYSRAPLPRYMISDYFQIGGNLLRVPGEYDYPHNWIPVTNNTSDDIGNCVFNAYHRLVSGVTALDAAVSIAELDETPHLFKIWQRRAGVAKNVTNGFLNYSFGWRPLISDLKAISREMSQFPDTVRRRLKALADGEIVRHYKFDLSNTVNAIDTLYLEHYGTYQWAMSTRDIHTTYKKRTVVVTIRAKVRPKLGEEGQRLLNKIGAAGLIPSLATLWSTTRLSFVVDWFYNVGAAIDNLQGCLTHDISILSVCVSDLRERDLTTRGECTNGPANSSSFGQIICKQRQRYYRRYKTSVPLLPPVVIPREPMKAALLGALALQHTDAGAKLLQPVLGELKLGQKVSDILANAWSSKASIRIRTLMGFPPIGP